MVFENTPLDILEKSPMYFRSGNVIFVHGGINPLYSDPEDYIKKHELLPPYLDNDHPLWIRRDFHSNPGPYKDDILIVHGHTFEHKIRRSDHRTAEEGIHEIDKGRLGLDSGSFYTKRVACAMIENGAYQVFTAQQ